MINVIRDEPVVVAITLDELLLAGEIAIELRYILFSAKVILVMFSLHKCGVKLSFIIYFQYMNGSCNNRSTYGYVQVVNNNV